MLKKKSLGQHFLRSNGALAKIVEAAKLASADTVVEVGPGEGVLTELLLQQAGKVIAVEKDDRLIPLLQKKFASELASGKFELVHGDILSLPTNYLLPTTYYKIVANLPYYITGQFLRTFLQGTAHPPAQMTLLLQKEVARRIACLPRQAGTRRRQVAPKESVLSISVKAYGTPRYIDTVKAGSFVPPPKVDSAILNIEYISKDFFGDVSESDFFALVRRGFAHPRKVLASNLSATGEFLAACGIPEKARAEDLLLGDWRQLTVRMGPVPSTREAPR
jgi:16S rRNA (adenine1518-N6/adenine1519-N6)-dimethyltransferase